MRGVASTADLRSERTIATVEAAGAWGLRLGLMKRRAGQLPSQVGTLESPSSPHARDRLRAPPLAEQNSWGTEWNPQLGGSVSAHPCAMFIKTRATSMAHSHRACRAFDTVAKPPIFCVQRCRITTLKWMTGG